jgi:DNA-binding response OmpR family regulator
VILLDLMMPGIDGFEVCRKLKTDPRTQHMPVIMVTALDRPSGRVRGLEAGPDDFLTKPVDDIALITRVRNVARLKMLIDEILMRASTEEQMGFAATARRQGGFGEIGVRHHNHELLAAEPARKVDAANVAADARCELPEHRVARVVSIAAWSARFKMTPAAKRRRRNALAQAARHRPLQDGQ